MDIEAFARGAVGSRDLRNEPDFPRDIWRAMAEAGLFRIGLDPTHGGTGGGYAAIAAAERALIAGGGSPGLGTAFAAHQMVARYFIERFGDKAQRALLLPALAEGRITASVAISEPGAGAHPKLLKTAAARDGDGWVIDGEKAYLTNGPIADLFVVFAIIAVEGGRKRYSAFLVPADAPGLARIPMRDIAALRPALHCGLRLETCRVGADAVLGGEGRAYETMALPFRDAEDAVGSAGTAGIFGAVLRRLGALAATSGADVEALGEMAGFLALIEEASAALVARLDASGEPPGASLVGIRVLSPLLLARARTMQERLGGGDARLAALFEALDVSLGVARSARLARQARLGAALTTAP
jgi:acyl-CoA dehydrogenase